MSSIHQPVLSRITVMLRHTETDRATLETLSLITAEMPAEILGLFIEDADLLSLADLPTTREYCCLTQAERRFQPVDIERQLRVQARAAEQILAGIASRAGLAWSFRTVRGAIASLLPDVVQEMDLMLLGAARLTLPLAGGLTSGYPTRPTRRPIVVAFDGSPASGRALDIAARMARTSSQPLTILLISGERSGFESLHSQVISVRGATPARFVELSHPELRELLNTVRSERASRLVLGFNLHLLTQDSIELLHTRLSCPAVLVR